MKTLSSPQVRSIMSHDPIPQTLPTLELWCRSLAQRILLIRELKLFPSLASVVGTDLEDDEAPSWYVEIQRHLRELPKLEERFQKACDEYRQLWLSLPSPLSKLNQRDTVSALQDLIMTTSTIEAQTADPVASNA